MTPELRMKRARTRLLIEHPFFGALAMRLDVKRDDSLPTMATDGKSLIYSAPFVDTLSDPELIGVYAHEVEHCALLHPFRRMGRDMQPWNVACDYAINQLLVDAGLTLPKGALIDIQYKGMSAEQIYSKCRQQDMPDPNGGKPSPTGEFGDAPPSNSPPDPSKPQDGANSPSPDDSTGNPTEQDWKIAAEQAAMASRKAGKMPGGTDRAMKEGRQTPQDWKQILREFIAATVPTDYSWSKPNRRYVGDDIYLPGTVKENTGEFVIGVDTSGSVDGPMLDAFKTEIQAIMDESSPEKIHVVYCDARVNAVQMFTAGDEIKLEAHGGGGTRFSPVFDWVRDNQLDPKALIYLTDLCGDTSFPSPDYPVLWVTPEWVTDKQPWGELVRMSA